MSLLLQFCYVPVYCDVIYYSSIYSDINYIDLPLPLILFVCQFSLLVLHNISPICLTSILNYVDNLRFALIN